jgi:hypothetical protein
MASSRLMFLDRSDVDDPGILDLGVSESIGLKKTIFLNRDYSHQSAGSKGIVTLLPKIHSWSGQLDKTRPITLLDSHRRILEAILNTD